MKLTLEGLKNRQDWEAAGIALPSYDIEKVAENTKKSPVWVHFGAGNIFRIFIGGLANTLLEKGEADKGITCVETFDFDVVDKIYKPYDNLVLAVTLKADGSTDKKVLGSLTEAIKAQSNVPEEWNRLKEIFVNPELQMISFTITEKGYALKGADGTFFPFIQADIDNGPDKAGSAMAVVCALLNERYKAGKTPLAVVSMDNCSHNGEKLQNSILTMAKEWLAKGFVEEGFVEYLSDEKQVSFPWSMIDKITPRPADSVCEDLEKAGVYLTDRDTVNKVERMKVTTCLNPLHTALAVYGCVLGYTLIADEMKDEQLNKLVHQIGPVEGMPVVTDPGILSPADFVDEVINVRIPNPFMPDTPQRIATDTSQKVGIRYGETIKSYVAQYGDAKKLTAIPLAIAGWCRYLLGVDDEGNTFERSADPMLEELSKVLEGIEVGNPSSYNGQLKSILSNANIFGIDLYEAGIGEKIEDMFLEEIAGAGAVRNTLKKYMA